MGTVTLEKVTPAFQKTVLSIEINTLEQQDDMLFIVNASPLIQAMKTDITEDIATTFDNEGVVIEQEEFKERMDIFLAAATGTDRDGNIVEHLGDGLFSKIDSHDQQNDDIMADKAKKLEEARDCYRSGLLAAIDAFLQRSTRLKQKKRKEIATITTEWLAKLEDTYARPACVPDDAISLDELIAGSKGLREKRIEAELNKARVIMERKQEAFNIARRMAYDFLKVNTKLIPRRIEEVMRMFENLQKDLEAIDNEASK